MSGYQPVPPINQIDKTLSEQLQINEREIANRKELLGFDMIDAELLRANKALIEQYIDAIVNQFYDYQVEVNEIALLIGDAETLRRLKTAMRSYILELFDGFYDGEYVNRRLRIGKVHERIGVSPKLYISAIYRLQKIITKAMEMHFYEDIQSQSVRKLLDAFNKIIMFDIQLVFDTYIASLVSVANSAKEELKDYAHGLEDEVTRRTSQLKELAVKDVLSGLYNQRGMYEHLRRELSGVDRYHETLSFVYLDLNGFKKLNDTRGHKRGDEVLAQVGQVLREAIREIDIACRYGGDEFCIILPRTKIEDARQVLERIIEKFKEKINTEISFSAGLVCTHPGEANDTDGLIKAADNEMYKAKARARKKPDFYISMEHCE